MVPNTSNSIPAPILSVGNSPPILYGWLVGVAVLFSHPRLWNWPTPGSIFIPFGLGLALVVWFGWSGIRILGTTACLLPLLLLVRQALLDENAISTALLLGAFLDPLLIAGLATVGWRFYRQQLQGVRWLNEPQSAVHYLLVFAVALPTLFALIQVAFQLSQVATWEIALRLWVHWFLSTALGAMAVGAPLLVAVPFQRQERPIKREAPFTSETSDLSYPSLEAGQSSLGDRLEMLGLILASGFLSLILVASIPNREGELLLWSTTLLPIVWACLRQGLRAGMLAASAAALFPVLLLRNPSDPVSVLNMQAGLLAQSAITLLIGASFTWVRISEDRYRQVVTRVPVVLYSARILERTRVPHAEVTLVGAASLALMGCRPEDLLGDHQRWLEQVHPKDREVVEAALVQLTLQNQPVICEYRLLPESENLDNKTPSSPARWLRDTLAPRFNSSGVLVGWDGVVTDISEQRRLADDLRRTSTMFHVLVTNLPAGIFFVSGATGRPILVNARARQLLGQREDLASGLDHLAAVYRLFRADGSPYPVEELPVYQALKHGRTSMRDDIIVHRPDGRCVPLVSWAAPLQLGGHGHDDAAVWVLEDLTALHHAENARRETEKRLRAIIETMGEGLILLDRLGKILECNSASANILQTEAANLKGKMLKEVFRCNLDEGELPIAEADHPVMKGLRENQPLRNLILGYCDPTPPPAPGNKGSTRWFLVNAVPLGQVGSPLSGVVVTLSDITTSRQAQEVLRLSEERYRGLIETLPLMVIQLDRNLDVEYMNPASTRISGYETEGVRDVTAWMNNIEPDDLAHMQESLARVLTGEKVRYEIRYRARDNSPKIGFTLAEPRWHNGQIIGVTCLVVDLTRERHLELELQHAQRLELIGRLSSGVAHDFNNLLTVVLNLSSMALSDLPPGHPVRDNLRQITDASEQAAALAGQLLRFGRHQPLVRRVVDLHPIAEKALDLVRALLPTTITTTFQAVEPPVLVRADSTQIHQVLLNLCVNAGDAMPEGGQLRIEVRQRPETGEAVLLVEDEGVGISEDVRRKIFEPFFTTKEHGTGLGLFVVQQIIEGLGGSISVTSVPGRGTRFEVTLPQEPSPGLVQD